MLIKNIYNTQINLINIKAPELTGALALFRVNIIVGGNFFAVFEVDSRHAGADAAEDLIVDGAVKGGKLVGGDGLAAVGADYGDYLADFYVIHVAEVDHQLIHTDAAHDGTALSAKEEAGSCFGKMAAVAVGITDGHGGDVHISVGGEGAAVADGGAGTELLHVGDHGLEAQGRLYVTLVPHDAGRCEAIEDDSGSDHIKMAAGKIQSGGAVGAMSDGKGDALLLQLLHKAGEA